MTSDLLQLRFSLEPLGPLEVLDKRAPVPLLKIGTFLKNRDILKTSPQAKRHELSLQVIFLTIFTSLTISTSLTSFTSFTIFISLTVFNSSTIFTSVTILRSDAKF